MNKIYFEDIEGIVNNPAINWNYFDGKTFFITGATGLIGSLIVEVINYRNEKYNTNTKLILSIHKNKKFEEYKNISYVYGDISSIKISQKIDFIIHAAMPTKSSYFTENPVETINSAILGVKNILEIAKENQIKSAIYLSSMEVYGTLSSNNTTEEQLGYIPLNSVRSSYSESKRLSELYCLSYVKEYSTPIKIARLAQVFGAGVSDNDNRLPNMLVKKAISGEDIVLKTAGKSSINFCYTSDAVSAIFILLEKGVDGEPYNICGAPTNLNVKKLANWVAKSLGPTKNKVIIEKNKDTFFAPETNIVLNNTKIKAIGWSPKYNIYEAYTRLRRYYEN